MKVEEKWRRRTLRDFSIFAVLIVCLLGFLSWALSGEEGEGISQPLRQALELNGRIWHSLYQSEHRAQERPALAKGKPARLNGDLGLASPIDLQKWKLDVLVNGDDPHFSHLQLSLQDLRALPQVQSTFEFKCIEGWSQVISYTGVRFSDFIKAYKLGGHSKTDWLDGAMPSNRFSYVALETPDGEYYVSLDMESMLHPQTLLVYEMNGLPLSLEHGAPLRLIVPVKYGIKSLKRIGKIYFSDHRPPDYWAERGYDWFSGL